MADKIKGSNPLTGNPCITGANPDNNTVKV
jgi:hypothetical protein